MLHRVYHSPRHGNKDDPLDELIYIVLSQMTTEKSYTRVFDRLKARFRPWGKLLRIPLAQLKHVISDAGLSHQKAPRMVAILKRIRRDFGVVSLQALTRMSDEAAEDYLTSLPGVGAKTAKCILMYSLGRRVLPVDTHVWRLARRLGLVDQSVPYRLVHQVIETVVAPADRYSFHVNAVSHGRRVCLSRHPRCGQCFLQRLCAYARRGTL